MERKRADDLQRSANKAVHQYQQELEARLKAESSLSAAESALKKV